MNVVDKLTKQPKQNKSALDKLNEMINGESPETKSMKNLIAMVSQTDSTALILGETGTGKDIVAQAIHKCSNKKGPFITVNCAAIPSELLESGCVAVNTPVVAVAEAPFGGIKQTGYGREGGSMAIKDYLNIKYTHFGISYE